MTELSKKHCRRESTAPHLHEVMPLSNTQPLKNGEIVVNGFHFKDVTHIKLTGHGREMEFVHLLRNGETLATVNVRIVKDPLFVHSLTDKKVIEKMLCPVCKKLTKVHKA